MHFFLKRFLQLYSSSCIDEFPDELCQGLENTLFSEKVSHDSVKVLFSNIIYFGKLLRIIVIFLKEAQLRKRKWT